MAALSGKKPESDFDSSALAVEEHGKNISDLTDRMRKIESFLETPQSFADFFESRSKDSLRLQGIFCAMFIRFLDKEDDVQAAISRRLEALDKHFVHRTWRQFGLWIGGGILFLLGVGVTEFVHLLVTSAAGGAK